MNDDQHRMAAWFAGPKAENGEWFAGTILRIVQDYHAWRRNYFPEDGVVVDSATRRACEPYFDAFEDRLLELLGRLKNDFPFQSPRYAAHMVAEQTLPSLAGYFAAMLYNPNNISTESAPVTARLEIEAAQMIARMLGYGPDSWAHLTSGGTVANIEALWIARSVRYLPLVLEDAAGRAVTPDHAARLLRHSPSRSLDELYRRLSAPDAPAFEQAMLASRFNAAQRGLGAVCRELGSDPVVLVPETHHYCFEKACDVLGLGRSALVSVGVDHVFRMRPDLLDAALDAADAQGRHILAVVAVVGTTEEGAVDPVDAILELRSRREAAGKGSFWLHADAAYGGYLRTLTVPARVGLGKPSADVLINAQPRQIPITLPVKYACDALERLGECDSITIDPHKLGYIPYPAGAICFRSSMVKPLVRQTAPYIADTPPSIDTERRSESVGVYILEGSKPGAAAAGVWLSHTLIPLTTSGHGAVVRDTIRSACELHALIEGFPTLSGQGGVRGVCLCPPGSNILCYVFRPDHADVPLERINAANRRIYERFTLGPGGRVHEQSFFVSRTTLSPRQYATATVRPFLDRLGVTAAQYEREGVFLLRSVLMNPWYSQAKSRGRYFLSELAADLYKTAREEFASPSPPA